MVSKYKILIRWLSNSEKLKLLYFLIFSIFYSIVESFGFFSIIPFIALVTEPNLIFDNNYLNYVYNYFNFTSERNFQIFFGFLTLAAIISVNLLSILQIYFSCTISENIGHSISRKLFKYFITRNYYYFVKNKSSDLSSIITLETPRIRTNILLSTCDIVSKSFSLILLSIFLIIISTSYSIFIIFIALIFYLIVFLYFEKKLFIYGKSVSENFSNRQSTMNESFNLIKEIKNYNLENKMINYFNRYSLNLESLFIKTQLINRLPKFFIEIFIFCILVLSIIYLIYFSVNISDFVIIFSTIAIFLYRTLPHSQSLYNSISSIAANLSSLDKINFNFDTNYNEQNNQLIIKKDFKKIKFANYKFTYPNSNAGIKEFNLEIDNPSLVFIRGLSGSGKSTLINLLTGLLSEHGNVYIDNSKINPKQLSEYIALVTQEVLLLNDSILQNISLDSENAKTDKVDEALKKSGLYDFINSNQDGLNFVVGENGKKVSGGQRQRIGIARAVYSNKQIIILDEPTSSLDKETGNNILKTLKELSKFKTILISSHNNDLSNIADRVINLSGGEITFK